MLNMSYYPDDTILSSISISSENDYYKQTDIEDSTSTNSYILNYNNNTPSLSDATIYDATSIIENIDNIEILPDSTGMISLVIHDNQMKHYCNELCTDNYKYKLDDFEFIISGYVNAEQNESAIFIYKYKNIINNNIIYDYVLNESGNFLYNNLLQDVIEKEEFTGYVDQQYFPDYTLKCIDSSNNIFYYKIHLIDLEYSQGNVVSSTFYDMTSVEYNNYNDDIQHSCKNLPVLLKSNKFKKELDLLRNDFKKIHIIFNIKNQSSTDNIRIDNNKLYFNQYMGCKFILELNINNINSLVNDKEYYLNRGAYLKYSSTELESYYAGDKEKILFNINSIGFDYVDADYDRSLLKSNNYITDNNYIPLELYKDRSNLLSVTLKDIRDSKTFTLLKDIKLSLMRQLYIYNQYSPSYNVSKITNISINNFKYNYASERTDFTSLDINNYYIVSKKFNSNNINTTAIHTSDITTVFNLLEDSLGINVFQRKVNQFNSILYIKYKQHIMHNYLYRYIGNNKIDLIINNIVLSITYFDYTNKFLKVMLFKPEEEKLINSYIDNENNITYMYNISGVDILKINNIYNKNEVDKYYSDETTNNNYYLPEDVIHITNNKK